MRFIKKSVLFSAMLLAMAGGANAQKAGDNIWSLGIANMNPSTSLGTLSSTGGGLYPFAPFIGAPAATVLGGATVGASASIGSVNTLSFGVLHMFTNNIAAEISLGIPPKMTVDVTLPNGGTAGVAHPAAATAEVLTPAVVAKYLFNTPNDQWRPYVGLGVTYASFNNVSANKTDPGVNLLAGTSASLSSSWAPIYNMGLIYNINERWSINASVSYIPLKTTATFVSPLGTTTTGELTLNPTDYVIRVGYKF